MKWYYPLAYILLASLIGFVMMGMDKRKATKNAWRIPERNFFIVALLGGSPGVFLGMHTFHHKTRHWYFRYGLPAILMLQAALLGAFLYWYHFVRV